MFQNLLPIGSVVLLDGATKKLMITGIKPMLNNNPEEVYDYVGVTYPEGFVGGNSNFLFNEEDIVDVIFKGYDNPERTRFLQAVEEFAAQAVELGGE